MPSLKDIAKVTAIAKVAYNKVYDLLEDDAKISDRLSASFIDDRGERKVIDHDLSEMKYRPLREILKLP